MGIYALSSSQLYQIVNFAANRVLYYREQLNEINVFPVADRDTGNNVSQLMNSIIQFSQQKENIKHTLEGIAEASLYGARGNSGLIFSQFFNGLASKASSVDALSTKQFTEMLSEGSKLAYEAVAEPVEGTILTAMSKLSEFCRSWEPKTNDFINLMSHSVRYLKETLPQTSKMLRVLQENHVVDAGAQAFYYFVEGMQDALLKLKNNESLSFTQQESFAIDEQSHNDEGLTEPSQRFCTEAIMELKQDIDKTHIKKLLGAMGDSVVLAQSGQKTRFHVHTNKPEHVFEQLSQNTTSISFPKVDDMMKQYNLAMGKHGKIAIVTDSTADLPHDFFEHQDHYFIPIQMQLGEKNYLDKLTLKADGFYQILQNLKQRSSTSVPDAHWTKGLLNLLAKHYQQVLVFSLGSRLSGTFDVIRKAAQSLTNVSVYDTKRGSGAQAMLILRATQLMQQGLDAQSIMQRIEQETDNAKIFIAVNNLKYMMRSGRLSKISGIIARSLNIKPILTLDDEGMLIMHKKTYSKKQAINHLIHAVKEYHQLYGIRQACVMHSHVLDEAKALTASLESELGVSVDYITEVSPAIGLHAGVGCLAIAVHSY